MDTSRTAPSRDSLLDLARTAALGIVVVWHWVFSTVEVSDTGLHAGSMLTAAPWLWPLTWLLQPMAVFFAIGGALHLASWRRDPDRFVARRARRLVVPALPLFLPAVGLIVGAHLVGLPVVAGAVILIISPLWFLAVYVVLMSLVPVTARLHERAPWAALAGLVCAVALLDVARFGSGWSGPAAIVSGFLVVWATVHQLGYWWERLSSSPVALRATLAATGLAGLAILPLVGPYPRSMVGVFGEEVSNMSPPNAMTLALALFHLGALALVAEPLRRFARDRHRPLATAQAFAMPVFVWHLAGYTVFFIVANSALGMDNTFVTSTWWSQRWAWLVGPAIATAGILATMARTHLASPHIRPSAPYPSSPGEPLNLTTVDADASHHARTGRNCLADHSASCDMEATSSTTEGPSGSARRGDRHGVAGNVV